MDLTLDNLGTAIVERLDLIQKLKSAVPPLPNRILRGPVQRAILESVGVPMTGLNKRLLNEVLADLGYRAVSIHGERFYAR